MIQATRILRYCLPLALFAAGTVAHAQSSPEAMRSGANVVFQFGQDGECAAWKDGSKTTARAYLWIPEHCQKLRGLLILCANVPEQMIAGDPHIRDVCSRHDLGIVFCPRSFYNFKATAKNQTPTDVAFLQQLLDGLAKVSGYAEVATVPWIPIGESGHLLMVDALVENQPDRCIAGIWLKNPHLPPRNRTVPALVIFGSSQEWGQDKADFINRWKDVGGMNQNVIDQRKANPNWPLTYVLDPTSGHFDLSDRLTRYVANYIDLIAPARLPDDPATPLRAIDLNSGCVADIPGPGAVAKSIASYAGAKEPQKNDPWFPSRELATEMQSIGNVNWNAKSQLPAYINDKGERFPYYFNGITMMALNHQPAAARPQSMASPMLETEADGITFHVNGTMLDQLPQEFTHAGEALAKAPVAPTAEWLCGPIVPLGNNTFRIALDRTWPSPIYVALREPGTADIRGVVEPGQIARDFNTEGKAQHLTFPQLPDAKASAGPIKLGAVSDLGLPVDYFVDVGPAVIDGGELKFTTIPPRAKFPITVTVGAWQGGRYGEPKIQRSAVVKQSFSILAP
jgi:hypothetical protein